MYVYTKLLYEVAIKLHYYTSVCNVITSTIGTYVATVLHIKTRDISSGKLNDMLGRCHPCTQPHKVQHMLTNAFCNKHIPTYI